MRRLSRAFLLVGMILAFVFIGVFALTAIGFFVAAAPFTKDIFMKAFESSGANSSFDDPETAYLVYQIVLVICGVVMLVLAGLCIPTAVVTSKARKNPARGLLVATIVFSVICGTYFGIAGAILGLIANKREERNNRRNNVVDAQ